MGEKTQDNLIMGYSAAYPTRAERVVFSWSLELEFENGIGDCFVEMFL